MGIILYCATSHRPLITINEHRTSDKDLYIITAFHHYDSMSDYVHAEEFLRLKLVYHSGHVSYYCNEKLGHT